MSPTCSTLKDEIADETTLGKRKYRDPRAYSNVPAAQRSYRKNATDPATDTNKVIRIFRVIKKV
jgi:hypothetical protein